ncbi:hypothetical protein D3C87_1973810 [compost metagenome]
MYGIPDIQGVSIIRFNILAAQPDLQRAAQESVGPLYGRNIPVTEISRLFFKKREQLVIDVFKKRGVAQ